MQCEAWTRTGKLLLNSGDAWDKPALGVLQIRLCNGKPAAKVRSPKENRRNFKILRAPLRCKSLYLLPFLGPSPTADHSEKEGVSASCSSRNIKTKEESETVYLSHFHQMRSQSYSIYNYYINCKWTIWYWNSSHFPKYDWHWLKVMEWGLCITHIYFFPFLSCHIHPVIKGFLAYYYFRNTNISQGTSLPQGGFTRSPKKI